MSNNARPLSPHLQVYRLPLAALLSILHRITGFGLALGAPLVVWWLFSISSGPESFAAFHDFTGSLIGQVMLFGWLYAFAYHFLNGLDVVVVGAGGAGLRATLGMARRRGSRPPASPRCSRPAATRWRRRAASRPRSATWARTTGAGTCTTPSRGRTGWATRTRSNIMCRKRRPAVYRARALRRAVLAHRRRQDLPAPVRRHDHAIRQGHRAAHLRRGRPHRPRDAAHAVPAER
jgi:succinate dehydrogenase / fumarate reductase cytochrome b subunit